MANSSNYYYDKGLNFKNEGNYDEALMYIDKAIEMDSNNSNYYYTKSECLFRLGNVDESLELINTALKLNPEDKNIKILKSELMIAKAKETNNKEDINKSRDLCDEILELNPNNAEFLNIKAMSLFEPLIKEERFIEDNTVNNIIIECLEKHMDQFDKNYSIEGVIDIYDELAEYSEDPADCLLAKAVTLVKIGKFDEAIPVFKKALKFDSEFEDDILLEFWKCYLFKGKSLELKSDYENALECYNLALEIEQNNPTLWYSKGHCLEFLSKHEEAAECYDKAFNIKNSPSYLIFKAESLISAEFYGDAWECLDKVLEMDVDKDIKRIVHLGRLKIYLYENELNNAEFYIYDYQNFMRDCGLYLHSSLIEDLKTLDSSIELIDKALESDENNNLYLKNKEKCLYAKTKILRRFGWDIALKCLDEVIELNPNNRTYWVVKGDYLLRFMRFNEAKECYKKALNYK